MDRNEVIFIIYLKLDSYTGRVHVYGSGRSVSARHNVPQNKRPPANDRSRVLGLCDDINLKLAE